ncbi:hypothetical protein ElyMa_003967900 [Elysia marginata]|uniref:Uncharacterized protein n=1 Tax=Elysia marginata TaxID=1093978 RepID=A0AAV4FWY5_9GAST|nr:hypothetical protein ElyMa_003967900 [Elysia marginata]
MVLGPGSEVTTIDSTTATCTTVGLDTSDEDSADGSDDNSAHGGENRLVTCEEIELGSEIGTSIIIEDHLVSGELRPQVLASDSRREKLRQRQSHPPRRSHPAATGVPSSRSDGSVSSSIACVSGNGAVDSSIMPVPSSRGSAASKGPAPAPPLPSPACDEISPVSPPRPCARPVPPARNKLPGRGLLRGETPKRSNRSNSLVVGALGLHCSCRV